MVQVPSEHTSKCRLMESTKRQISREKARHDARAERSGGGGLDPVPRPRKTGVHRWVPAIDSTAVGVRSGTSQQ